MIQRIGKAFWAQAVERRGIVGKPPEHYIEIVRDVAGSIKIYLEDS